MLFNTGWALLLSHGPERVFSRVSDSFLAFWRFSNDPVGHSAGEQQSDTEHPDIYNHLFESPGMLCSFFTIAPGLCVGVCTRVCFVRLSPWNKLVFLGIFRGAPPLKNLTSIQPIPSLHGKVSPTSPQEAQTTVVHNPADGTKVSPPFFSHKLATSHY